MFKKYLLSMLFMFVSLSCWAAGSPTLNLLLGSDETLIKTVLGNPNGNVTLIEFTDYNCPYCKVMTPIITKLTQQDKKLRVIIVDYPVIAPTSVIAAQAALAAANQGKYMAMHTALMAHKSMLTPDIILSIAKKQGLDMAKFTQDMESDSIKKQLNTNLTIGNTLGIPGTPTVIIAPTLKMSLKKTPEPYVNFGYLSFNDLQEAIQSIRANKS